MSRYQVDPPQLGHSECKTLICTCGEIIQSCTCQRRVKCIYEIDAGCYKCMGIKIEPLTKYQIEERIYWHVMGRYYDDPTTSYSATFHLRAVSAEGIKMTDVAAANLSLLRQRVLELTPDRDLIPGPKRNEWMVEHWDD